MNHYLSEILSKEQTRQQHTIELIASENIISPSVAACLSSAFANKYSEWVPYKRYYAGQQYTDELETLTQKQAKHLFGMDHWNVQPHSGSPANLAIQLALLSPGDTILSLSLDQGGHLSHGHKLNFSAKFYNIVSYHLDPETHRIDMDEVARIAQECQPKLIIAWFSAYPRDIDWSGFQRVAQSVGAYLLADISHTSGLIAANVLPSPAPYVDIIMSTTHKTLRGPRGAIIGCRQDLAAKIDRAVFPGVQWGPHMHVIAAKLQAFYEASSPQFVDYARQIVDNAQTLAQSLMDLGYTLISGGTDTHLILVDMVSSRGLPGKEVQNILESVSISCNKNMIPGDTRSAMDPSGIRFGTAALTTRGLKAQDMRTVASYIDRAISVYDSDQREKLWELKKEIEDFIWGFDLFSQEWICE